MKYTDQTDATTTISLYEQGQMRRPDTGKTLLCLNSNTSLKFTKKNPPKIITMIITLEDVKEALIEADSGYFTFIGSDMQKELMELDNNYLTHHIQSLNMWNGRFIS